MSAYLELQDYAGTIKPQPELRHKITTEVIKWILISTCNMTKFHGG